MDKQQALPSNLAPQAELKPETAVLDLSHKLRLGEQVIQFLLIACGILSIFTTVGIFLVLMEQSLVLFAKGDIDVVEFLTSTEWNPVIGDFGLWPLLLATLRTSFFALLVSVPLGLGAAIYLSEYASPDARKILKPILEVLAGIPTVVYGFFALTFMTPLLQSLFGDVVSFQNTLSAGLVMGVMILPLVASMSEDALSAVPRSLREASVGLGATKLETSIRVVLPAALSGVIAAFILAASRAVGETMIVAIAAGSGSDFTFNPFVPAETITGYIARISGGDTSYGTPDYQSIFALGLALFIITFILNILSRYFVNRFREEYE
jgi:phosphate transport system permease protein